MSPSIVRHRSLAPRGGANVRDRTVGPKRRHFITLIRIAAPPVIISALGSVLVTIGFRELTATGSSALLAVYFLVLTSGVVLYFCGTVFSLIVMGGATRNLVTHLLWNEPVTASATYAAVRSRFWGLLGATLVVMVWVGIAVSITFVAWYMVFAFVIFGSVMLAQIAPIWLSAFVGVVGFIAVSVLGLWLLFFLAGRV